MGVAPVVQSGGTAHLRLSAAVQVIVVEGILHKEEQASWPSIVQEDRQDLQQAGRSSNNWKGTRSADTQNGQVLAAKGSF